MKIICFGAHPDDVEMGMGGTICKFIKKEHDVYMFIARECNGERYQEQLKSNIVLGMKNIHTDGFGFDDEMVEIKLLTEYINRINPNAVYIPWIYDSNQHHRKLAKYVLSALRRTNVDCYMYNPITIRGVTLQKFIPLVYEDISKEFDRKIESIKCHISQIKRYGNEYLEYVKNKDAHYGYEIGVKYAEVFQLIKEVRK